MIELFLAGGERVKALRLETLSTTEYVVTLEGGKQYPVDKTHVEAIGEAIPEPTANEIDLALGYAASIAPTPEAADYLQWVREANRLCIFFTDCAIHGRQKADQMHPDIQDTYANLHAYLTPEFGQTV